MIALKLAPVKRASLVLAVIGATLCASGCTQLLTPLGAENYDCNRKENPASPYCHSFRAVTDGTNTAIPDSRYDAAVKLEEADRMNGIAPAASAADGSSGGDRVARTETSPAEPRAPMVALRQAAPVAPPDGAPVRVAPLVQRTWI